MPITKHINSISVIRIEEEKNVENNKVGPIKSGVIKPIEVIDRKEEIKDEAANEPVRTAEENLMRQKVRELVKMPKSQPVSYYLKHKINKELIEGLVGNQRFNDSLLAMQSGGLKYMDALVDQGSDVNIMPLSTYNRLTNKKLIKTDIRLSLASQSHIQPLGIAEEVLVEIAGFIYPADFVILYIKEDRRKPFILGTPFLTTTKAEISTWMALGGNTHDLSSFGEETDKTTTLLEEYA
ncbi:zinc finger, CCHC-type containing protein [Tanacetum coccineum]